MRNPTNPSEIGFYDTPHAAGEVAISGTIAYVADRGGGLRIVDVSDPTQPAEVGFFDVSGLAMDVTVSDDVAYLASGEDTGLRILDVSDPTNPTEIGFYVTSWLAQSVTVSKDIVFVGGYYGGLYILRQTGRGLFINKDGPQTAVNGELITYTVHINNNLSVTLTGVVITDAIPVGATYVGGGTQVGNVVSWTVPSLVSWEA